MLSTWWVKTSAFAPVRQRIDSIFQTWTEILTLERHDARTL
jgi:hypothetical protein